MADKAGLFNYLWNPKEEFGITRAGQLIEGLQRGLNRLRKDPDFFAQYNPKNGWGNYEILVEFTSKYLEACKKYPEALVEVSR